MVPCQFPTPTNTHKHIAHSLPQLPLHAVSALQDMKCFSVTVAVLAVFIAVVLLILPADLLKVGAQESGKRLRACIAPAPM